MREAAATSDNIGNAKKFEESTITQQWKIWKNHTTLLKLLSNWSLEWVGMHTALKVTSLVVQ